MNNEINESINKQSQVKIKNEKATLNITNPTINNKQKRGENENNTENYNINNEISNKQLNLSPIVIKGKLKVNNNPLEIPLKTKKVSIKQDINFKKKPSINKTKTFNVKNQNLKKKKEGFMNETICPMKRKAIFYDNKDYNILNLLHITNKLYENENHLNKGIISKKPEMANYSSNLKDLIKTGRLYNANHRKNLVITFDLKDQNNNVKNDNNVKKKSLMRKRSYSSKVKEVNGLNKEKVSFSNYVKIGPKYKNSVVQFQTNNINNNEGDIQSKFIRNKSRAKTTKNINNVDILEDNNPTNNINTAGIIKSKTRKISINSLKNQTNDLDIKNETPKNDNYINKFKKKRNKYCCLLCCLNTKLSESGDEL